MNEPQFSSAWELWVRGTAADWRLLADRVQGKYHEINSTECRGHSTTEITRMHVACDFILVWTTFCCMNFTDLPFGGVFYFQKLEEWDYD